MKMLLADYSVSLAELKKKPAQLLKQADGAAIAIINHNKPAAYLVPAQTFKLMMDLLDEYTQSESIKPRLAESLQPEQTKGIEIT